MTGSILPPFIVHPRQPKVVVDARREAGSVSQRTTQLLDMMGLFIGKLPSLRAIHERSLDDEAAVSAASIAVERINGPVFLISHTDDRVWPATHLAEMAIQRLEAHHHPFPYEHLSYEGAGHPIGLPYSAPDMTTLGPFSLLGGTLEANGHASADSWTKVLGFLEKHLELEWRSRPRTSMGERA